MLKNKKCKIFIITVAVLIIVFSVSCFLTQEDSVNQVDLQDIETMNIGAEMPEIVYGDEDKLIMSGSFGVIYFDLRTQRVYDRIPVSSLENLGSEPIIISSSENGKNIYSISIDKSVFKYNPKTRSFSRISEIKEELFRLDDVWLYDDDRYAKYVDYNYLSGSQILTLDNRFMYLRADTDWSMRSLQLVIVNTETDEINVIKIFNNINTGNSSPL